MARRYKFLVEPMSPEDGEEGDIEAEEMDLL